MKRSMRHFLTLLALLPGLLWAAGGDLETATASKRETAREFWVDGVVECTCW